MLTPPVPLKLVKSPPYNAAQQSVVIRPLSNVFDTHSKRASHQRTYLQHELGNAAVKDRAGIPSRLAVDLSASAQLLEVLRRFGRLPKEFKCDATYSNDRLLSVGLETMPCNAEQCRLKSSYD